jgi:hypothetical protein
MDSAVISKKATHTTKGNGANHICGKTQHHFIKFKKKWYYVSSKVIQPLSKLPSFDDCYAQFTAEDNKKRNAVWSDMKELFFEYAAEE